MQFPECLKRKGRKTLPEKKINNKNLMYARHKPGVQWKIGDEFPDFKQIRSDQSFNWSAFSIPVWARFNERQEFFYNYGVMGYSVHTIRNAHLYKQENEQIPEKAFGITHKPLENNYSHCEIFPINAQTKIEKRSFRYYLVRINSKRKILPKQYVKKKKNFVEFFIMMGHRIIVWFS